MSKREWVIIGVMIVSLLFGIWQFCERLKWQRMIDGDFYSRSLQQLHNQGVDNACSLMAFLEMQSG